jgi:thiol-disulfide isomerase/thioredoxin
MWTVAAALVLAAGAAATPAADRSPEGVLALRVVRGDGTTAPLREVVATQPTIVAFWASWCAPCRAEVPTLNRAVERWRRDGVRVLGAAVDTDADEVRRVHDAWEMRYDTVRLAPGQDAALERVLGRGLPATVFVQGGRVVLHDELVDDAALERLVPSLLHDPPP